RGHPPGRGGGRLIRARRWRQVAGKREAAAGSARGTTGCTGTWPRPTRSAPALAVLPSGAARLPRCPSLCMTDTAIASDQAAASATSAPKVRPGAPFPLGATCDERGVNFALYSEHAERVELVLFDGPDDEAP